MIRHGFIWMAGVAALLASCGVPSDRQSSRSDSAGGGSESQIINPDEETAFNFVVSGFDERAVVLVQIQVPYCRDGVPEMQVHNYCSGTVISNRHVLTAAHCFATECPGKTTVFMNRIKIPNAPPAKGFDMVRYNWSKNTLSPINLLLVPGGAQAVGYTKKNSGWTYTHLDTTVDQAVLDFGANALSANFPELPWQEAPYNDGKQTATNNFFGAGYGSLDGRSFVRTVRTSMPADKTNYFPSSGGSDDAQLALMMPKDSGLIAGCHGDSGGPLIQSSLNKVVGIASVKYRPDLTNTFAADSGVPDVMTCTGNSSVTYSMLDATALTSVLKKSPTTVASTVVDIDLWNPRTPGDALGVSNAQRFVSTLVAPHAVLPNTAVVPTTTPSTIGWAQIPDPTGISPVIPSYYAGGKVDAIAAGNTGARSATWSATGLRPGKYKVEIFYRTDAANATCIAVHYQTTLLSAFATVTTRLNQRSGSVTVGNVTHTNATMSLGNTLGTFASVVTNLTPVSTTYINVPKSTSTSFGTLKVRISDSGCPSGRMVADALRLTWMSN